MDGNAYAALAALIRGEADTGETGASAQAGLGAVSARMRLGKVVSVQPLAVNVAGLVQPASALRINERMVKGARWKTKITSSDSDYKRLILPFKRPPPPPLRINALIPFANDEVRNEVHSEETTMYEAEVEQLELDLEMGDEVLLLTQDDQIFYIIMKVAKAE